MVFLCSFTWVLWILLGLGNSCSKTILFSLDAYSHLLVLILFASAIPKKLLLFCWLPKRQYTMWITLVKSSSHFSKTSILIFCYHPSLVCYTLFSAFFSVSGDTRCTGDAMSEGRGQWVYFFDYFCCLILL